MVKDLLSAAMTAAAAASSSLCPDPTAVHNGARFHSDAVCDRAAFNNHKSHVNRHGRYTLFKEMGTIMAVPNQKTALCPMNPQQFQAHSPENLIATTGLDTVWVVENTASVAVSLSFVNEHGVEMSAVNTQLLPGADPESVLQPGQWMAVQTYEGHVFYARELLPDGTTGRVLLQHRVGLIPIGANIPVELLADCPLLDIEPVVQGVTAPEYQRTPPQIGRPCNTMDVGFRNVAGCPLHAYYVIPGHESQQDDCSETFKFHLGRETAQLKDFMWDWQSATKYEGTFVGHTFRFRLAHNPTAWSQTITLAPTQIPDCPELKQAVAIGVGGEAVPIAAGEWQHLGYWSSEMTLTPLLLDQDDDDAARVGAAAAAARAQAEEEDEGVDAGVAAPPQAAAAAGEDGGASRTSQTAPLFHGSSTS